MFAFIKVSVESLVLTPKDVQKNEDMNVETKVQITKVDQSRVDPSGEKWKDCYKFPKGWKLNNQQKNIKQRAKLK